MTVTRLRLRTPTLRQACEIGVALSLVSVLITPLLRNFFNAPYFFWLASLSSAVLFSLALISVRRSVRIDVAVSVLMFSGVIVALLFSSLVNANASLADLLNLLALFLLFLTAVNLQERIAHTLIVLALIGVSLVLAVIMTLAWIDVDMHLPELREAYLTVGNRQAIGGAAAAGASLGMYFFGPNKRASRLLAIVSAVCIVGMALNFARGAIVSALLGIVVIFFFALLSYLKKYGKSRAWRTWRRPIVPTTIFLMMIVIISAIVTSVPKNLARFTRLIQEIESEARLTIWKEALVAISHAPAAGLGVGGYSDLHPVHAHPHNLFLQLAEDGGMLTVLLFLVLLGFALARAFMVVNRTQDWVGFATLGFLFVAFFNAQTSGSIYTSVPLVIALGLAISLSDRGGWAYSLTPNRYLDSPLISTNEAMPCPDGVK